MGSSRLLLSFLILSATASTAAAATIAKQHPDFVGGGTIFASELNDNFNDLFTEMNLKETRITNLETGVAGKEPSIAAGTSLQYLRGDKTWQNFQTDVLACQTLSTDYYAATVEDVLQNWKSNTTTYDIVLGTYFKMSLYGETQTYVMSKVLYTNTYYVAPGTIGAVGDPAAVACIRR